MAKFESSSRICHVYILRDYISRNYPQNNGENGHFDTSEKPVILISFKNSSQEYKKFDLQLHKKA